MKRVLRIMWVCSVLLLLGVPGGTPTHGQTDRSAYYVGFGWFNHGEEGIPHGVSTGTSCEGQSWTNDDEPTLGVAAVAFCDVPQDASLHVQIMDAVLESVTGTLTCTREGETLSFSWRTFDDETNTSIPSWCGQHPSDEPGTTRVSVYLNGPPDGEGAVTGEIRISY